MPESAAKQEIGHRGSAFNPQLRQAPIEAYAQARTCEPFCLAVMMAYQAQRTWSSYATEAYQYHPPKGESGDRDGVGRLVAAQQLVKFHADHLQVCRDLGVPCVRPQGNEP